MLSSLYALNSSSSYRGVLAWHILQFIFNKITWLIDIFIFLRKPVLGFVVCFCFVVFCILFLLHHGWLLYACKLDIVGNNNNNNYNVSGIISSGSVRSTWELPCSTWITIYPWCWGHRLGVNFAWRQVKEGLWLRSLARDVATVWQRWCGEWSLGRGSGLVSRSLACSMSSFMLRCVVVKSELQWSMSVRQRWWAIGGRRRTWSAASLAYFSYEARH
jgi:hypothetical protein